MNDSVGDVSISSIHLGQRLYNRGWRQGSLIEIPGVRIHYNSRSPKSHQGEIVVKSREVKANEKLVLISQDCDIVASESLEPRVEALLCIVESDKNRLASASRNGTRNFAIDLDQGLVADARYRTFLDKKMLDAVSPIDWPGTREHLGWFVQWLARRYNRPALEDSLVAVFQRPIINAFDNFAACSPEKATEFNRAVRQLRVSFPEKPEMPYNLHLTILVRQDALTQDELDAIDDVTEVLRGCLNSSEVILDTEAGLCTPTDITLQEYEATWPLYLDSYTYNGAVEGPATP